MEDEIDKQDRQVAMFLYRRAMAPVMADLSRAGVHVQSLRELLSERKRYLVALPVLLDCFKKVEDRAVKDEIARTLSCKWARPTAAKALIEGFRDLESNDPLGLRWTIGNALFEVADDSVFEPIVELLEDARFGRAREMLALALGRMKNSRSADVLIRLLDDDDDVVAHAARALGNLKAPSARAKLTALLGHERSLVRRAAKRALAKISPSKAPHQG